MLFHWGFELSRTLAAIILSLPLSNPAFVKMVVLQASGWTPFGLHITMLIAAVVVVALRFVAKWNGKIKLGPEDALILAALATFIAYNGIFFKSERLLVDAFDSHH